VGGLALITFVLWFFFGQREDAPRVAAGAAADALCMPARCTRGLPAQTAAAHCSICGMKLTRRD
jgi:hypothetical protein